MKTTIEVSDAILRQARQLAAREHTTLRALVEQGLRRIVAEKSQASAFRLRRASFRGNGLQTPDMGWERLREMAYEAHGG